MSLLVNCDSLHVFEKRIHIGTCAEHGNVLLWGQAISETDHLHSQPLPQLHLQNSNHSCKALKI